MRMVCITSARSILLCLFFVEVPLTSFSYRNSHATISCQGRASQARPAALHPCPLLIKPELGSTPLVFPSGLFHSAALLPGARCRRQFQHGFCSGYGRHPLSGNGIHGTGKRMARVATAQRRSAALPPVTADITEMLMAHDFSHMADGLGSTWNIPTFVRCHGTPGSRPNPCMCCTRWDTCPLGRRRDNQSGLCLCTPGTCPFHYNCCIPSS